MTIRSSRAFEYETFSHHKDSKPLRNTKLLKLGLTQFRVAGGVVVDIHNGSAPNIIIKTG